jgi:hypothetical protein
VDNPAEFLALHVAALPPHRQDFAKSLLSQLQRKGALKPKAVVLAQRTGRARRQSSAGRGRRAQRPDHAVRDGAKAPQAPQAEPAAAVRRAAAD